ncbi:hypothetical protein ICM05_09920 [Leucobacter sp. cx-42]|uniref:hypothetical protein n=1 Tax=unclassified Leucobacter TaxID=2621730 RepID=UPI00165E8470|nr:MULTISPECIES: hypothetical protein [unclassified Leucobacter]MBC9954954.1 hypothetical protein [Leucobacter sp. cx-42]
MSYLTQSRMAQDYGLIMRIAACAAVEGRMSRPASWADDRRIGFMATPGWAAAYAASQARYDAAVEPKPLPPGEDGDAITDEMIRDEVVKVLAAETPPPVQEPEPPL